MSTLYKIVLIEKGVMGCSVKEVTARTVVINASSDQRFLSAEQVY
jgi:hypothetical protein